jgi:hypothetical protein
MAGVDLTRFDFNAKDFMHSDNVRSMSLKEIGQYVLLLCEAWLTNKDASLPNNPDALKTMCRGELPSELVLSMFPIIPETGRRRNNRLYTEWMAALGRASIASDSGRRGNESRWGGARVPVAPRFDAEESAKPNSIAQAKPIQSVPNQTDPNTESESHGQGTFKNIAVRYSSYFTVHSKSQKHKDRYYTACNKYGENRVLEYFDRWAQSAGWLKEKHDPNGLNFFWRPLEEMAEGDELRVAREQEQKKFDGPELTEKQAEQIITSSVSEQQNWAKTELEKKAEQKKWDLEHQDEI